MTQATTFNRCALLWVLAMALAATMPVREGRSQIVDGQGIARANGAKKKTVIRSSRVLWNKNKGQAVFSGQVKVIRKGVTVNSDKLVVSYREIKRKNGTRKNDVTFLNATGNVIIVTASQRIAGRWAKMDMKANTLVVGGGVTVKQGQNIVRGPELFIDLNTNQSRMSGGRVESTFSVD